MNSQFTVIYLGDPSRERSSKGGIKWRLKIYHCLDSVGSALPYRQQTDPI
jgi:hypothetical protein